MVSEKHEIKNYSLKTSGSENWRAREADYQRSEMCFRVASEGSGVWPEARMEDPFRCLSSVDCEVVCLLRRAIPLLISRDLFGEVASKGLGCGSDCVCFCVGVRLAVIFD